MSQLKTYIYIVMQIVYCDLLEALRSVHFFLFVDICVILFAQNIVDDFKIKF